MMFKNRRIEARHLYVGPDKDVLVFLEESFAGGDFFKRACDANGDFLYNPRFNGNIDFDGGGNIGHITFFKSVRGRDRVIEPIYRPRWEKILGFDCVDGILVRRLDDFL